MSTDGLVLMSVEDVEMTRRHSTPKIDINFCFLDTLSINDLLFEWGMRFSECGIWRMWSGEFGMRNKDSRNIHFYGPN
jgi:hypothetical protein